jgi:hypothetical protein
MAPKTSTATATPGVDVTKWAQFGRNVRTHLDRESGLLFIAVNTNADAYKNVPPTGKGNVVIGTTQGNQKIEGAAGALSMGINIYGPPPAAG